MLQGYTSDQLGAFWAGVSGLAAIVTTLVAVFTLLRIQRDSNDRSRPVMGAYLQHHPMSHGTSELVVTNYGSTPACNVTVTFDPPIPKLEGGDAVGKITPFLERRYSQTIPTVAPGMQLLNVYTVGGDNNDEPVPADFVISFNYGDSRGKKRYSDSYHLTVETLRNNSTTSTQDKSDGSDIPKRTVHALESIARGIGRK